MAQSSSSPSSFCTIFFAFLQITFMMSVSVTSQPTLLPSNEQEAVYQVLASMNPGIPWRSMFSDDLCSSAPHGIVCDYFPSSNDSSQVYYPHIAELSFGYVSDYSPNPQCNPNATLDPSLLSPLRYLRKLFFYKCFTDGETPFPDFSRNDFPELEELVFIENKGLSGSLEGKMGNLKRLRRLVLTGSRVSGPIPSGFFDGFSNLEELTLSRNKFKGEIPMDGFENLRMLKVLDLSSNGFYGNIPASVGKLSEVLKIDMSYNGFSGRIPQALKDLKRLEFLDLSFNRLNGFGVPLFLSEMSSLKLVYLSGNSLGGHIPEIWENLGGILGIGLSGSGLVGQIPKSMGVHLRNLCYLGLDNNTLEGAVPEEFENLQNVSELNLQNNRLSGKIPFSPGFLSKLGVRLKVEGNLDLCVDEGLKSSKVSGNVGKLKVCRQDPVPENALFSDNSCQRLHSFLGVYIACVFLLWVFAGFSF